MASTSKSFTYVLKNPGQRAVAMTLPEGAEYIKEVYRIIEATEGNPPGRKGSFGDMPYPAAFERPNLRVAFDDEFGFKPLKANRWGIKGAITVARLEDGRFASLRDDEIEGVIADLDREPPKDPNDQIRKFGF